MVILCPKVTIIVLPESIVPVSADPPSGFATMQPHPDIGEYDDPAHLQHHNAPHCRIGIY